MREIVHVQAGQCGNQIGAKVTIRFDFDLEIVKIMIVYMVLVILFLLNKDF